jgi:hypothetical protein
VSTSRLAVLAAALGASPFAIGCDDGETSDTALNEPLQVSGGQFIAGNLPGLPPAPVPEAGSDDGGAPNSGGPETASAGPIVVDTAVPILGVPAGASGIPLAGHVSLDAVSVAMRMVDAGTGFWVVPVGSPDTLEPGTDGFSFPTSFNPADPAGVHAVRFVAINSSGAAGYQADARICLLSSIPDNAHACNPTKPLPAVVISLRWDTNFDVDLHVRLPDGSEISPKSPAGNYDGGPFPPDGLVRIDRDSLASCVPDGYRQEDVVFQDPPPPGKYLIYADPFAACGQAATRYTLTIYESRGTCPSCQQVAYFSRSGELLASQVTGGGSPGLFTYGYVYPHAN